MQNFIKLLWSDLSFDRSKEKLFQVHSATYILIDNSKQFYGQLQTDIQKNSEAFNNYYVHTIKLEES